MPVTVTVNTNHAPTVSLGGLGGTYTAPANIALTASAADSDGVVTHVSFYAGSTLIGPGLMTSGTASSGSYVSNAWTNVAAGTYAVTAVATDEDGAVTISSPVTVTVGASAGGATGIYFINADHLGTPRLVEDLSQQPVWKWDAAEAFGDSVPNESPGSSGAFVFNLAFPGQYRDVEIGTNYNYYRQYDPNGGRYIQSDPIGLKGGLSTYAYALGNPVQFVDIRGLQALPIPVPPPPPVGTPGNQGTRGGYDPKSDIFKGPAANDPTFGGGGGGGGCDCEAWRNLLNRWFHYIEGYANSPLASPPLVTAAWIAWTASVAAYEKECPPYKPPPSMSDIYTK